MTDKVGHVGPGPYETEREAVAAVRHIYDTEPGTGAWRDGSLRMLEDACRAAGVQVGPFQGQRPSGGLDGPGWYSYLATSTGGGPTSDLGGPA